MSDSDSEKDHFNLSFRDRSPIKNNIVELRVNRERNFDLIVNNVENNLIMANLPQAFHIQAIPNYDGDRATLAIFLSACDNLLNTFANRENLADPNNEWLLRTILSKLEGRARILVGSREDATNWPRIRTLLLQYFSDQRNEDCLVRDLMNSKPKPNESPYQFGTRIQDVKSLLQTKIRLTIAEENERLIKNRIYDNLALQTFLHGLQGQTGLAVRLQHPNNLEQAMSFVLEEENFMYAERHYKNSTNQGSHSNKTFSNITRSTYFPQQSIQPLPIVNRMFSAPQRPSFNVPSSHQNTNNFVAMPPRQVHNFPMQRQFNAPSMAQRPQFFQQRPVNNFGPNLPQRRQPAFPQNNSQQQYKPTPMETSTRNTTRASNFFRPNPNARKTFVSEELYHNEVEPQCAENTQTYQPCETDYSANYSGNNYYFSNNEEMPSDANTYYYHNDTEPSFDSGYTLTENEADNTENFQLEAPDTNQT